MDGKELNNRPIPFGHIIGIDRNNVIAFSSDYHTKTHKNVVDHSFISIDRSDRLVKIFCGIKYQCVEYVRRWLILKFGISFQEIDNAYMLYTVENIVFKNIYTNHIIHYTKCSNGSTNIPEKGTLIIWDKTDTYKTGHVAIVSHVDDQYIYIGEQNWDDRRWNEQYSRKILMTRTYNSIILDDSNDYNLQIIGWLKLTISV